MKAEVDDGAALRPSLRTIREEAPRGPSGSNGTVERAMQSVTQQTKVRKYRLEDCRAVRTGARHFLDSGASTGVANWERCVA